MTTGEGDQCTTGCLLDYPYFKGNYKIIEIDLSKQVNKCLMLIQYRKIILLEI